MGFGFFYHGLCKPFGSSKCELTCGRNMVNMLANESDQICNSRAAAFAVEIWAEMGQNNTHGLEEQFVHLATSTSIVAPM